MWRLAPVIGAALLLSSCQIDSTAPMRAFDITNVAQTGVPVAVNASISAVFASRSWCQDEGAMAIAALSSAGVAIQPVACREVGGQGAGQFSLTTSLVRTAGGRDPSTVVEEVLDGNPVRFAVFPHGTRKELLSVGIFLDVAKLEAAKAQLVKMPVVQEGLDAGQVGLSLSIVVTNDLPNMAKFYLKDVSADTDPSYDQSVLEIPPGGSETITLDPEAQTKLMQRGWVNFFAMAVR